MDLTPDSMTLNTATRPMRAARSRFPVDREGEDDPSVTDRHPRPRHQGTANLAAWRVSPMEDRVRTANAGGPRDLDAGTVLRSGVGNCGGRWGASEGD